ncbi:MAG: POTRA domain-containing protein, partial [Planctomycetota bacterium]
MLAFAVAQAAAVPCVRAQTPQGPGVPVQPGARQGEEEVVYDPPVLRQVGRRIVSVAFARSRGETRPDRITGADLETIAPEAAASYLRGLAARVGQAFEPRMVSEDCAELWRNRRVIVAGFVAPEGDGVAITYVVLLEQAVFVGIDYTGIDHLDRATVDALLGVNPGVQITRTEAEAMRKVLLARYRREGYAHAAVGVPDRDLQRQRSADILLDPRPAALARALAHLLAVRRLDGQQDVGLVQLGQQAQRLVLGRAVVAEPLARLLPDLMGRALAVPQPDED